MVSQDQLKNYTKKAGLTFLGYVASDFIGRQLPLNSGATALIKAGTGTAMGILAPKELKTIGVGVGADALTDGWMIYQNKGSNSEENSGEDLGGVV